MKFSHIADVHIGAYRDDKLREINMRAFLDAIDISIRRKVDFVIIAGDLFNSAVPGIEQLKQVVAALRMLKDHDIPVYGIAGSHDYSAAGKTMLDVLERADLFKNVCRGTVTEDNELILDFTVDPKTGAKLTGIVGKKGMLDKHYYERLKHDHLEQKEGFKIFLFHTAISELKPADLEQMDAHPLSLMPKNFDYYAGGHVHIVKEANFPGYTNVIYPGPTFPNNFSEIEKLEHGGFYIYDDGDLEYVPLALKRVVRCALDCTNLTPGQVTTKLLSWAEETPTTDAIVLLRLQGALHSGKPSEIDLAAVSNALHDSFFIMKNLSGLKSNEFTEVMVQSGTPEEVEERLISESMLPLEGFDEKALATQLMHILSLEKLDGEKVQDYDARIVQETDKLFKVRQ